MDKDTPKIEVANIKKREPPLTLTLPIETKRMLLEIAKKRGCNVQSIIKEMIYQKLEDREFRDEKT